MKKFLLAGTILLISAVMVISMMYPNSEFMLFASAEPTYNLFRLGMTIVLLALLFSTPPRSVYFRALLGVSSILLGSMVVAMFRSYSTEVFDAVILIEVATIFLIEALESSLQNVHVPQRTKSVVK